MLNRVLISANCKNTILFQSFHVQNIFPVVSHQVEGVTFFVHRAVTTSVAKGIAQLIKALGREILDA